MSNYELYKGDCLEVMANNPSILERANMILIDPPYGILNKKAKWDNIIDPSEMWNLINDNTKITVPTLVFCQEPYASLVISENIKNFKYKYYWQKTQVYGNVTKDYEYIPTYDRYPTQLLTYKSDKQLTSLHPTQKPVPLLENLIKTFTNEGDTVLDFCMGSGSSGEAALNCGRNFIGIEKDENYFQICLDRLGKL